MNAMQIKSSNRPKKNPNKEVQADMKSIFVVHITDMPLYGDFLIIIFKLIRQVSLSFFGELS